MTHDELVWDHFKFNAQQRLTAFHFFLAVSIFANGGVITALEKKLEPELLTLLGVFLCLLAVVFWIADARSKQLLSHSVEALLAIEKQFPEKSRLFAEDRNGRNDVVRYSVAIATLLVVQFLFGIYVVVQSV